MNRKRALSPADLLGIVATNPLPSQGDGCDLHLVCATCPFPLCQFDLPETPDREHSDPRHSRWWVVALVCLDYIDDNQTNAEIGAQFHTTEDDAQVLRTAARWIRAKLWQDYENDPHRLCYTDRV